MSIIDQGTTPSASSIRWTGYGLASAGLLAGFGRLFQAGPTWTSALLALAPLALATGAWAPDVFEIRWRGGARG